MPPFNLLLSLGKTVLASMKDLANCACNVFIAPLDIGVNSQFLGMISRAFSDAITFVRLTMYLSSLLQNEPTTYPWPTVWQAPMVLKRHAQSWGEEIVIGEGARVVRIYVSTKKVTVDLSQVRDTAWDKLIKVQAKYPACTKIELAAGTDVQPIIQFWMS